MQVLRFPKSYFLFVIIIVVQFVAQSSETGEMEFHRTGNPFEHSNAEKAQWQDNLALRNDRSRPQSFAPPPQDFSQEAWDQQYLQQAASSLEDATAGQWEDHLKTIRPDNLPHEPSEFMATPKLSSEELDRMATEQSGLKPDEPLQPGKPETTAASPSTQDSSAQEADAPPPYQEIEDQGAAFSVHSDNLDQIEPPPAYEDSLGHIAPLPNPAAREGTPAADDQVLDSSSIAGEAQPQPFTGHQSAQSQFASVQPTASLLQSQSAYPGAPWQQYSYSANVAVPKSRSSLSNIAMFGIGGGVAGLAGLALGSALSSSSGSNSDDSSSNQQ